MTRSSPPSSARVRRLPSRPCRARVRRSVPNSVTVQDRQGERCRRMSSRIGAEKGESMDRLERQSSPGHPRSSAGQRLRWPARSPASSSPCCSAISVVIISTDDDRRRRRVRVPGWRRDADRFKFALSLLPFAGLFFLWFIAVTRERLGRFEDQFFATVFLGSGLLFLALMFAAAASAGAIVATYARDPSGFADSTHLPLTRGRRSPRSSASTRCAWRPSSSSRRPRSGCAPG